MCLSATATQLRHHCTVGTISCTLCAHITVRKAISLQRSCACAPSALIKQLIWQNSGRNFYLCLTIYYGTQSVPTKQALARNCGLSFCPSYFEREEWLRGRDCENKCGQWQSPLCLRFYLGDSHGALLLGMTFEVVAITATLFEQWCAVRKTKKAIYKRKARGKPCLP